MELMVAILFFSLAAAVCIQLFAKAHTLSLDTVNQNNAVTQAQNLAEAWLASDENTELVLIFDKNWNLLETPASTDVAYIAKLESLDTTDSDALLRASVTVCRVYSPEEIPLREELCFKEELLFLELSKHIPEKRGEYK